MEKNEGYEEKGMEDNIQEEWICVCVGIRACVRGIDVDLCVYVRTCVCVYHCVYVFVCVLTKQLFIVCKTT